MLIPPPPPPPHLQELCHYQGDCSHHPVISNIVSNNSIIHVISLVTITSLTIVVVFIVVVGIVVVDSSGNVVNEDLVVALAIPLVLALAKGTLLIALVPPPISPIHSPGTDALRPVYVIMMFDVCFD